MSISSISSISFLNLWLDGTDLSTMTIEPMMFNTGLSPDLFRWTDKSSNAYQFIPLRSNDRPKVSTNGTSSVAVLFDQISSFQLVSLTKAPVNSTMDFFAVLTPYSLWGPRQPIFDSANITVCETDTRFNTQIYADGNEFFRNTPTQNLNNGAAIYRGSLYIGTNAVISPNYLQRYNRFTRTFEYHNVPMTCNYTHALAVYNGFLYTAGGLIPANYNNPGGASGTFGTGVLECWDGTSTRFRSTLTIMSTFPGPICINRRQLYTTTWNGWAALYRNNNTTTLATQPRPQLYTISTPNMSSMAFVTEIQTTFTSNLTNGTDWNVITSNMISYRGDLWINMNSTPNNPTHPRSLTRLNGGSGFYNSNNMYNGINGYISLYWGSIILPLFNETRMFKWNDYTLQNFGRSGNLTLNSDNQSRVWHASGGICTYKGLMHTMYGGSNANALSNSSQGWQSNYVQVFSGENGATYSNSSNFQLTTNSTGVPQCNLMIVHDGKLFMQNGFSNAGSIIEYGNGTSVDQSFSTLTSGPIILQIRKSPTSCQMYLNGSLVESQSVNFTYSNQNSRELWVGGAAGMMASGQSDSGSDHFQGAIHTIAQYGSNLNTADRQKVEGILAWTYGIQNILPVSHPYRNSSP